MTNISTNGTGQEGGPIRTPRRVSVSSWALHGLIGTVAQGRPGDSEARMMAPHTPKEPLDLLHVPRELAKRGITTMELCHFHVPTREAAYLQEFTQAREEAGVELWSVLIDDGDLNHPEHAQRDRDWILGWIDTASALGAKCTRVIAGKQEPTEANVAKSREQLLGLMVEAYLRGVHLMTENWFATLSKPEHVHTVLEPCGGSVGLCLDFGNWSGPDKYSNLADIAPYAESCHAKCNFVNGEPDTEDYERCLRLATHAGFSGPFTLVYGEPDDIWGSIERQRELLNPYL
jgi:sugar phosphate isomerase/epimerase